MAEITGYAPTPTGSMRGILVAYNSGMYVLDHALQAKATTQYIDYDFNSMVKFGNIFLGACSDGIFELDGDTDNGTNIGAYFEPIVTDFGISNPKKIRFVFLGYESEEDLIVTLAADEGAKQSYVVDSLKTGQQSRRMTSNRNMEGRYLMLGVSNTGGCDFGIDSIDIVIVTMPHTR